MNFPDIGKLTESISKVRLRGGVVGKVATVLVTVALAMAIISWSAGSVWIAGAALAFLFILTLVGMLQMISFAKENPQAALYEGAEMLIHERMKMGMKNLPELNSTDEMPTLPSDDVNENKIALKAKEPDQLPAAHDQDSEKNQKRQTRDD